MSRTTLKMLTSDARLAERVGSSWRGLSARLESLREAFEAFLDEGDSKETPDQHKARTGRCPAGFHSDEAGKCVASSSGSNDSDDSDDSDDYDDSDDGHHGSHSSSGSDGGKSSNVPASKHVLSDKEFSAYVAAKGGRVAAGAQLTSETRNQLKKLGVDKLPPGHVKPSEVVVNLDGDDFSSRAVMSWRDQRGKLQQAYTEEFHKKNAAEKWDRVGKLIPKIGKISKGLLEGAKNGSDAHAAALVIAKTGLRVGGEESLKKFGHHGITSMQSKHLTFEDDGSVSIKYEGKAGAENTARIDDPEVVEELKKRVKGKKPEDRVFNAKATDVREVLPKGVHPKDFRTAMATKTAHKALSSYEFKPSGDEKADRKAVAKVIAEVSKAAAKSISNTPAVALESYIHPKVLMDWMEKHKVPVEINPRA